jgi:hypothetical protein
MGVRCEYIAELREDVKLTYSFICSETADTNFASGTDATQLLMGTSGVLSDKCAFGLI